MTNLHLIGVHVSNKLEACNFFKVDKSKINTSFNETEIQGFKFSTFIYTVAGLDVWCYAVEAYNISSNQYAEI